MYCKLLTSNKISILSSLTNKLKINLLDINRQQMQKFFLSLGEKKFRADQVMKWIYHYYCDDFDQMTDINKYLRTKLKNIAEIRAPKIMEEFRSIDGTVKWSLKVSEQTIEMVYIPDKNRATLCVSSQVGCAMRCTFCATGQQGFNRNLRVSEIIGQIWQASKIINSNNVIGWRPITNIVMMGMGEPLLNIANVIPSIEIMLDNFGFGLSKRHVTLSTSGVVPALEKLGDIIDVKLAISLHAPNDIIRNEIMPINRKYNIESLLVAVRAYLNKSNVNHGQVTVEYVMISNINDREEHAHELAYCLRNTPCKINLIPWNSFLGSSYIRSSNDQISCFAKILVGYGLNTIIRKTRGDDINAACGQLAGDIINRTKRTYIK